MREIIAVDSKGIYPIVKRSYNVHASFLETKAQASTPTKQIYNFHLYKQFGMANKICVKPSFGTQQLLAIAKYYILNFKLANTRGC